MTEKSLTRVGAEILLGYLMFELYLALRPANLTEQISEWMETSRGRFARYYAERDRHLHDPPTGND